MKNIVLILLLMSFASFGKAQVVITNSSIAPAGTIIVQATDSLPDVSIVPGSPGPNKTWDFSLLHDQSDDTTYLLLPQSTPYADSFPNANFAFGFSNAETSMFGYFIRNDQYMINIGLAMNMAGSFFSRKMMPGDTIMYFPVQYGDHHEGSYSYGAFFSINSGSDSVRSRSYTTSITDVDAYGTLIFPFGTYNVLRTKEIDHYIDSMWVYSSGVWNPMSADTSISISYSWATDDPSAGFQLVNLEMKMENGDPVVSSATFLKSATVGIAKISQLEMNVFPNPVQNNLNIRLEKPVKGLVEIYDVTGKILIRTAFDGSALQINVSELKTGVYFVVIKDQNGLQPIATKKIFKKF
jgi:hypothetical protein